MVAALLCLTVIANRQIAAGQDSEKNIPIPAQKDWPKFFGEEPIAEPDSRDIGHVRYWYYTFRADWDDVVTASKLKFEKVGYERSGRFEGVGRHHKDSLDSITFRRGLLSIITIVLDDDSYTIYKDCRLTIKTKPYKDCVQTRDSGWIAVIRAEPVGGYNLRNALEHDAS